MAEGLTVEMTRLLQQFGDMADATTQDNLTDAAMAGGFVVEGAAKTNVIRVDFIDTGATLNSIAAVRGSAGQSRIGPATEYAIYGELGTTRMRARPFLRPALENNRQEIADAVKTEIQRILENAAR